MKMAVVLWVCLLLFSSISTIQGDFFDFDKFMKLGKNDLDRIRRAEEVEALSPMKSFHPVMQKVFGFLTNNPYIKKVGYSAVEQLSILKEYMRETGLSGDSLFRNLTLIFPGGSIFKPCDDRAYYSDSTLPFPFSGGCCPIPQVKCKKDKKKYRTFDGSCNCITNTNMGRSNRAYSRYLPPDYGDGLDSPRRAKSGNPLPSARKVSTTIYESKPSALSQVLTVLHMTMGQTIDHDTDRTPISKFMTPDEEMVDVECGDNGCETEGPENMECFPMHIPGDDPIFKSKKCLMFVRSQAFLKDKCDIGPRQQPNVITSWFDASHVYGSTYAEQEIIRDYKYEEGGRMTVTENPYHPECGPLIPYKKDPSCRDLTDHIKCFLAGDARQNEQNALTAMHITSIRQHNYFADKLHEINPHWSGGKVFQEARRILIATWQNMIYDEYLPPLLGPKIMKEFNLNLQKGGKCTKDYDCENHNADVTNVFATSAFRFGHSQIGDFFELTNADFSKVQSLHFSEVLFRPRNLYMSHFDNTTCGVDAVLLGNANQRADKSDRFFTEQMSNHMFTDEPPKGHGQDLPATNTQRGRDHGIPGYTKWRKICGLSVPKDFDDMEGISANVQQKFRDLYEHVDDIDLFPAAMAEEQVEGAIVGPTFACLLAHQFRNAKIADRFWFERCSKSYGFTKAQLKNLREYTLGRFYCDTLVNIKEIQPYPMMLPISQVVKNTGWKKSKVLKKFPLYRQFGHNERKRCEDHPGINWALWKY